MNNYHQAAKYELVLERFLRASHSTRHVLKISAYRQLFSPLRKPYQCVKGFSFLKICLHQAIGRFKKISNLAKNSSSSDDVSQQIQAAPTLSEIDLLVDRLLELTQSVKK